MDGALSSGKLHTYRHAAMAFRDGLIIAFFGHDTSAPAHVDGPTRRQTTLETAEMTLALEIPAEDVKTKRPLDFSLPPELSRRIDIHLDDIRPRIRRAETTTTCGRRAAVQCLHRSSMTPCVSARARRWVCPLICTDSDGRPQHCGQCAIPKCTWREDLLGYVSFCDDGKALHHGALALGWARARADDPEATGERSGTQRSPRG